MYVSEFMEIGILEKTKLKHLSDVEKGIEVDSTSLGARYVSGEVTEVEAYAEIREEYSSREVEYPEGLEDDLLSGLEIFTQRHLNSKRSGIRDSALNWECGCNEPDGRECVGKLYLDGVITREEALANLYHIIRIYWEIE